MLAAVVDAALAVLSGLGPTLSPAPTSMGSWAEVIFEDILWFVVGFALIRLLFFFGVLPKSINMRWLTRRAGAEHASVRRQLMLKSMRADAASGQTKAVLAAWDQEAHKQLPSDLLRVVVQALTTHAPERLVPELAAYLGRHASSSARTATLGLMVEVTLQHGPHTLAHSLAAAARQRLCMELDAHTQEALVRAAAAAGEAAKVIELLAASKRPVSARCHAAAAKGFLLSKQPELAARHLLEMRKRSFNAPPRAYLELFQVAIRLGHEVRAKTLAVVEGHVPLPADCFAMLLSDCARREDVAEARRLEGVARAEGTIACYGIYEPLLKLYAKFDPPRARELFKEMQTNGFFATEGLCGSLLSKCSESQNRLFAEDVAAYLRGRSMMTLATYKTLMKVYACCGLFDQACALYKDVLADGLQPDHVMYGCLMKFSVKCKNIQLTQELFEKADGGDVQNYMWFIRAAARDGDVDRALRLLRRLEAERPNLEVAVYNCALHACVMNGATEQAEEVLATIKAHGMLNLVTYNTLIKGHCIKGDLVRAREVIGEISKLGLKPDGATFNCVLGAMVAANNLDDVWNLLQEMEDSGVAMDHYTVSIMMKAAKKARGPQEADRALAVLDRTGIAVCEDEVVFNTVLDACVQRRDKDRLVRVLATFEASQLKPSVHTYGLLFKAFGLLRKSCPCLKLWREMVEDRGMKPNDMTTSCMLDALVCTGLIEEAAELFHKWKVEVPSNTVMYSTLIKGFASIGDADRALEIYHEMRSGGFPMNLVSYTSLIDAQARVGNVEKAAELLKLMEADGCTPNTITYSALVKGYCLCGDLRKALQSFQKMLARGLLADTVIFNTMLDGCVRHSHFELADQLLTEMAKYGLQPSNVTLTIVVKMWGKRHDLEAAFRCVRKAFKEGKPQVDTQVCTCLVSACVYNRDMDRALEAFMEIKTWLPSGGADTGTYGTLISGLARHGRCHEAVAFAREACELASRPKAVLKPLAEETLRMIFQAVRHAGLAAELGPQLAEAVRAVGLPATVAREMLTEAAQGACGPRAGQNPRAGGAPRAVLQRAAGPHLVR